MQITELQPNQIFVFGSNTRGIHGRGAALQAYKDFGAQKYVGEGLTGRCYALPTLNVDHNSEKWLVQRTEAELVESIFKFYRCAAAHPELDFLLTKVGCGLAGYDEQYMKMLFRRRPEWPKTFAIPSNIRFPEGWEPLPELH